MNKPFSKINTRYLSFLFKQNKRFMLFLFFAFFVVLPFTTFLAIYNMKKSGNLDIFYGYYLNSSLMISLFFYIVATLVVPGFLLSYLMSKSKMDTYQTLPIRKQDLFFNQIIHIIGTIFIPYAIAWILALLIAKFYGGLIFDFPKYLLDLVYILLFTPLLIGVPIFTHLHCGRLVDSIMYGIFLHGSQFLAYMLLPLLFNNRLAGLKNSISPFWQSLISYDFSLYNLVFNDSFYISTLFWIIFGFVLYFINQYFYQKRPVQDIGKPILSDWFFPVVSTILIAIFYALLLVILMNSNNYINGIVLPFLISLLFYIGLDVINNRGFKYALKATLIFVGIAVVTTTLIYGVVKTGLFGLTKYVPTPAKFDMVTVYSSTNLQNAKLTSKEEREEFNKELGFEYRYSQLYKLEFKSEEEKQYFVEKHKELIDIYHDYAPYEDPSFYQVSINPKFKETFPDYKSEEYGFTSDLHFIYKKDNNITLRRTYPIERDFFDYLFSNEK